MGNSLRALVMTMVVAASSCGSTTVCEPVRGRFQPPGVLCSSEYAGLEVCTAPASGTFFACTPSTAACWTQSSDGPCFPPVVLDGGGVSCPSGQTWKAKDCAGVVAGVRSCFGLTLAQCGFGCWYPVGVCLADGGVP